VIRRKRWPPAVPGVLASEIICGRTIPFTLAPGNPLRAAACLQCGQAIGGQRCYSFMVQTFHRPAHPCGGAVALTFLIHEHHPQVDDATMAALAVRRHKQMCGGNT
jgi:hypothetical protein